MATIKGKWKWVGTVLSSLGNERWNCSINFNSNGIAFSSLIIEVYAIPTYVEISYDHQVVQMCYMEDYLDANGDGDYEVGATLDEKYRIMDFGEIEQEIDDELYAFIVANATEIVPLTMAEKLQLIAENEQKVYDAGYQLGYKEGKEIALPIEVSSQAEMTALLESGEVGGVYKYTGESGIYENGLLYILEENIASNEKRWGKLQCTEYVESSLTAPTIDISENTLNIHDEQGVATSYDLLVDGEVKATVAKTESTFDLSTLELSDGTYSITLRANAEGYESVISNVVSYTVAAPAEYSVTINSVNNDNGQASGVCIYDGYDENLDNSATYYSGLSTVTITSGYISLYATYSTFKDATFNSDLEIAYQNGNNIIYRVDRDATINITSYPCLVEGTQISLADGTTKAVEDVTMADDLLVWDFYEGKQSSAKPMWILPKSEAAWYTKVSLSNNTVLKMVGPHGHRMYNVEKEMFLYPSDFGAGEHTVTSEGDLVTIRSIERINETVNYYNIITDMHYNLYAENILTSCRLSNRYGIAGMKYNTDDVRMTEEEVKAYIDELPC